MILPIEKQVTSLELSKKIKELGFQQHGCLFYWARWRMDDDFKPVIESDLDRAIGDIYAAPTVAEWSVMLPTNFASHKLGYKDALGNSYMCEYYGLDDEFKEEIGHQRGENEADTRANMWIYLVENGLLEVKK